MTVLCTGKMLQLPQRSVLEFPWKPQKGLEAVGMANKCVEAYLANNQANHKGKKYIKQGKKICSLLGKLLNVSDRGMFGFVEIKEVDGLLGAAQNVEGKRLSPLHGVSELTDGSGRLRGACGWRGRILQACSHSSVRQLSGMDLAS